MIAPTGTKDGPLTDGQFQEKENLDQRSNPAPKKVDWISPAASDELMATAVAIIKGWGHTHPLPTRVVSQE